MRAPLEQAGPHPARTHPRPGRSRRRPWQLVYQGHQDPPAPVGDVRRCDCCRLGHAVGALRRAMRCTWRYPGTRRVRVLPSTGTTTLRIYSAFREEADQRAAGALAPRMPAIPSPPASPAERAKTEPRSPYEHIAAQLREQILSGQIPEGSHLPSPDGSPRRPASPLTPRSAAVAPRPGHGRAAAAHRVIWASSQPQSRSPESRGRPAGRARTLLCRSGAAQSLRLRATSRLVLRPDRAT
jgi:hypothetical protein